MDSASLGGYAPVTIVPASFDRSFNSWQKQRTYGNENELILALRKAILAWNDKACFRSRGDKTGCRDKAVTYDLQVDTYNVVPQQWLEPGLSKTNTHEYCITYMCMHAQAMKLPEITL